VKDGTSGIRPGLLVRGVILIATLVAIAYGLKILGLDSLLDESWIDSRVRGQGLSGDVLFVAVGALAAAVGFPRQVIAFLGGYAFGFATGTALALVAIVFGCAAAFTYARVLGRGLVAHRFGDRIRRIDAFLADNPFSMTLLIRLLPIGSNLATNLAAGVSRVPAAGFIAGSAVGYIPQTMAFGLAGSGVNIDPVLRIGLAAALLAVSGAIGLVLYRRYRHGKTIDEDLDTALGDLDVDGAPTGGHRGGGTTE